MSNNSYTAGTFFGTSFPQEQFSRSIDLRGARLISIQEIKISEPTYKEGGYIHDVLFAQVTEFYTIKNEPEVRMFFQRNLFLYNLIKKAYLAVKQAINVEPQRVVLELFQDHEASFETLFIIARLDASCEDRREAELRFRYNWLYNQSDEVQEKLNFVVETL